MNVKAKYTMLGVIKSLSSIFFFFSPIAIKFYNDFDKRYCWSLVFLFYFKLFALFLCPVIQFFLNKIARIEHGAGHSTV